MATSPKPIRPFETRYWLDGRKTKPMSKGFPKAQAGSITGAAKAVAQGFAVKVQCIHRHSGAVLWTVRRGQPVPGVSIRPVLVFKGDDGEAL